MDEFEHPYFQFGRLVFPLQWFSTPSENGAIVGLSYGDQERPLAAGSSISLSFEIAQVLTAISPVDVPSTTVTTQSDEDYTVTLDADLGFGDPLFAFDATYSDIEVGGGVVTLSFDPRDFGGTSDVPINIELDMPRFDGLNNNGVREVFGGTFGEAGTTHYVGQENLFDTVVLPGPSSNYRVELDSAGSFFLTTNNPTDPLSGERQRYDNFEEVIFGGDPLDRSDFLTFADFDAVSRLTDDEIDELVPLFNAYLFNTAAEINFADFAVLYLNLGRDTAVFADFIYTEAVSEGSVPNLNAQDLLLDFTDPANEAIVSTVVMSFYNMFLGRAPDAAGQAFWEDQLTSGNVTKEGFWSAFRDGVSAETGGALDKVYLADLGEMGQQIVREYGFQDTATLKDFADAVTSGLDDATREVVFSGIEQAYQAMTDGMGDDDQLTVTVVGLPENDATGM